MKTKKIVFILSILFFGISCKNKNSNQQTPGFSNDVTPEEVGFSSERLSRIDSLLIENVTNGVLPNAVTFIARHGKIVHYKAYGWRNIEKKEPLQKNDIFRIASQTKAITSVALMTLYEEGKFLLDEPISKYIPEFKNPQVIVKLNEKDTTFTARPAKCEITFRHLLTHTSGITYSSVLSTKAHIPNINSLEKITIEEAVKRIARMPLAHDPGDAFTYGFNTDIIGRLIEILSGMPLDKYMDLRIFQPLGMTDSYFYLPKEKENRLVTLYSKDSINGSLHIAKDTANQKYPYAGAQTYFSGGAGVVGTIEDYAKFCQMLLNGGVFNGRMILGRKTIDMMTTNQIGDLEVWGTKNKFGLGFEIVSNKGVALLPGSIGSFRWGGIYCTNYNIDPKEDLIVLLYTNAYPFVAPDFGALMKVLVYQAMEIE